ncbi:MAG: flhB [Solirubrobacterales bacterium]|jgi:flagellar biosynthetic protein FlhB|nr:flhB [Solirubrobacterales bacterium]
MADKTEKATPKRREEARAKGQVARSMDLNGAVVLLAGLFAMSAAGAAIVDRMGSFMRWALTAAANPNDAVSDKGAGHALLIGLQQVGLCVAPIAAAAMIAGIVVNLAQTGVRPTPKALKPDPRRLNPISGIKNIFGLNGIVEAIKSIVKVSVVGAIVAQMLVPKLRSFGAMVGMEPVQLGSDLASNAFAVAKRAAIAYLLIGIADVFYQRYRHEKSLRMDHQEIKDESKQQQLPAEVRGAIRRRQQAASRARMMEAVPTADVVITNPTHYAVALKYESGHAAPVVVAKGADIIAARIREIARENHVPLVPDPPLARSLHRSVEVGQQIPEDLFGAVAQVLAYVYRMAGRRGVGV